MLHQRLLHQSLKKRIDILRADALAAADGLGGLAGPTSGKGGQPHEELPLRLLEQRVAPVDECAQRLLARERRAAPTGERAEAIVQPCRDPRMLSHAGAGGEFEGEWDAASPGDLRHDGGVCVVELDLAAGVGATRRRGMRCTVHADAAVRIASGGGTANDATR